MMGWQWHQLEHMQIICTSLQTDNHTSTSPMFSQARCPSCRPTNSVKALKANTVGWLVGWLIGWSLTSLFSTNMAISETKGQGWKVIRTQ